MNLINFSSKMTSLEIAELTGKEHKNILADIRDESNKLGAQRGQLIFQPSYYTNIQNKQQPMYVLTKEGVLQLAARYDAVIRFKLIEKVTSEQVWSLPQLILQQAQYLVDVENRVNTVESNMTGIEKGLSRLEQNQRRTISSNHLTVIAYANMKNIHPKSYNSSVIGKKATKLCREKGYLTGAIVDSRYGNINTYPLEILDEVFFG